MAFLCQPIQLAQVMTRMNLNTIGNPDTPASVRRTIVSVLLICLTVSVLSQIWPGIYLLFLVYAVYAGVRTRLAIRKKFQIGNSDDCSVMCGDCVTVFFCGCCSLIQMSRHTDDGEYDALSPDGLPLNATPVQVGPTEPIPHAAKATVTIDEENTNVSNAEIV